jgi:hypothetical protein
MYALELTCREGMVFYRHGEAPDAWATWLVVAISSSNRCAARRGFGVGRSDVRIEQTRIS